jgi:hypothetical protein
LTKLVEIVGEAAKSISITGRASLPDVPWRAAARMRDRLVHHYFDINLDVLWQTISLPTYISRSWLRGWPSAQSVAGREVLRRRRDCPGFG